MHYGDPARCIIASLIQNIEQAASNKHTAPSLSKAETKVLDTADRQWEKYGLEVKEPGNLLPPVWLLAFRGPQYPKTRLATIVVIHNAPRSVLPLTHDGSPVGSYIRVLMVEPYLRADDFPT